MVTITQLAGSTRGLSVRARPNAAVLIWAGSCMILPSYLHVLEESALLNLLRLLGSTAEVAIAEPNPTYQTPPQSLGTVNPSTIPGWAFHQESGRKYTLQSLKNVFLTSV